MKTLADLGTESVTINVFGGGVFSDVFVAEGIWNADQIDPSYDGHPARFIAETATSPSRASPPPSRTLRERVQGLGQDRRLPAAQRRRLQGLLADARRSAPTTTRSCGPCLEQLVPIFQQAAIDYYRRPGRDQRDHRRRGHAVRHVLDLHGRARRLLGEDAERARPGRQRPGRHARQHGRGPHPGGHRRRCATAGDGLPGRPRRRPTCSPTSSSIRRSASGTDRRRQRVNLRGSGAAPPDPRVASTVRQTRTHGDDDSER